MVDAEDRKRNLGRGQVVQGEDKMFEEQPSMPGHRAHQAPRSMGNSGELHSRTSHSLHFDPGRSRTWGRHEFLFPEACATKAVVHWHKVEVNDLSSRVFILA